MRISIIIQLPRYFFRSVVQIYNKLQFNAVYALDKIVKLKGKIMNNKTEPLRFFDLHMHEIVYYMARVESKQFQSRATRDVHLISLKTEIGFPHEPHIYYFLLGLLTLLMRQE